MTKDEARRILAGGTFPGASKETLKRIASSSAALAVMAAKRDDLQDCEAWMQEAYALVIYYDL